MNANFEKAFLTTYGLQNYVSLTCSGDQTVFAINGSENRKMIEHARHLIEEICGGAPQIVIN